MVNTSTIEEKKKNILSINNFSEVNKYHETKNNIITGTNETNEIDDNEEYEEYDNVNIEGNNISISSLVNTDSDLEKSDKKLEISRQNSEEIIDENDMEQLQVQSENKYSLLQGGVDIIYNIDYLLEDDEKLINFEKVIKQVDIYINNYNSPKIQKYKQSLKQLYQKYSNKNFIISTTIENIKHKIGDDDDKITIKKITKIIVKKNDKSKKIITELIKPTYFYYNEDNYILNLKRNISNDRAELLYKYEKLIAKLNITPEDKKIFEKERKHFIEKLEDYYIYTLYHKKINKINTLNKSSLVLQKEISIFKEQDEYESKILSSNIYSVDNSFIDTMNKYNSENLIQFNNIMQTLNGKKEEEINKDKKIKENIKSYIKNRNEIELFTQSLIKDADIQDNYINFIVLHLP